MEKEERLFEPYPWKTPREYLLSTWRAYNTSLDTLFYDVSCLTQPERVWLSSHDSPEGSILIVHPGSAVREIRNLVPKDFVEEQAASSAEAVDTIVVAGVGSSAIGTAALARSVADQRGQPVAGIVSGLGVSDVLSEALGGWFILGAHNTLRDNYAKMFDALGLRDHVRDQESHEDIKEQLKLADLNEEHFIYGSPDSTALLYVLLKLGSRIKLLVGHSKGNYSIENAMEGWIAECRKNNSSISSKLCVVTLGAVLRFPEECSEVEQFIGTLDFFGAMNSRPDLKRTYVPGAWHSLNTRLPGHLSMKTALESFEC